MLEVRHPVEARLARGQKHVYELPLSGTQFVRFTISAENPASDVQAALMDPDGKQIEELSGPVCPFSLYYMPILSERRGFEPLVLLRVRLGFSQPP
jgi:hypothetical protein